MMRFSLAGLVAGLAAIAAARAGEPLPTPVTFYKDVLPILQNKCHSCHRPGQAAPISFMTYRETRPWASAIKKNVVAHRMPPWLLDVRNLHRVLTQREIETLVRWVDTGALRGDPRDAPPHDEWARRAANH